VNLKRHGSANKTRLLWRPDHPERKLQSLNDWYGFGFLLGVTGSNAHGLTMNWFCGKVAAQASYMQGYRDGRSIRNRPEEDGNDRHVQAV
jgi:hypothetical protein